MSASPGLRGPDVADDMGGMGERRAGEGIPTFDPEDARFQTRPVEIDQADVVVGILAEPLLARDRRRPEHGVPGVERQPGLPFPIVEVPGLAVEEIGGLGRQRCVESAHGPSIRRRHSRQKA